LHNGNRPALDYANRNAPPVVNLDGSALHPRQFFQTVCHSSGIDAKGGLASCKPHRVQDLGAVKRLYPGYIDLLEFEPVSVYDFIIETMTKQNQAKIRKKPLKWPNLPLKRSLRLS
jgi:hypothetical protein